jgi:glucosylceramidase
LLFLVAFVAGASLLASGAPAQVEVRLTDPDASARFERQNPNLTFGTAVDRGPTIEVRPKTTYQTVDGFGYTLTGGSAGLIARMSPAARGALLRELFATEGAGLGIRYLRVSIGASDLDERVFSYDDLPPGQSDPGLTRFSLAPDRRALIPVLKQVLAVAPDVKVMGSPWSPPAWMKTNHSTVGGSLKPEFYGAYRRSFERYVLAMRAEGVRVDAVTVHNEPLHPVNNPSLLMRPRSRPTSSGATSAPRSCGPGWARRSSSTTTPATGQTTRSRSWTTLG